MSLLLAAHFDILTETFKKKIFLRKQYWVRLCGESKLNNGADTSKIEYTRPKRDTLLLLYTLFN